MALVNTIKVGDFVSHYGTYRKVVQVKPEGGQVQITVEEDGGVLGTRTEGAKTDLAVRE